MGLNNIDLWRSEEMQLIQLLIPSESAHDTIEALGELGLLQFKDLNVEKSAFQRTFANQVRRCDDMVRKIRFFREQIDKAEIPIELCTLAKAKSTNLNDLEHKLARLERELSDITANHSRIQRSASELSELSMLLEYASQFFDSARREAVEISSTASLPESKSFPSDETPSASATAPLLANEAGGPTSSRLGSIAGLIPRNRMAAFERMLFRSTRGNLYLRQSEVGLVRDPATGDMVEKAVFLVFYSGDRARLKISRIAEAFGANKYPLPDDSPRQRAMAAEVRDRLSEMKVTLEVGELQRDAVLKRIALEIDGWATLVGREKLVCHTLNKLSMDVARTVLIGEAWIPTAARTTVLETLQRVAAGSSGVGTITQPLTTNDSPPTYFRTNKFTSCFQAIVDAYGTARYREVNPTVFTIMTFPFLFAVMFGDFGHGFLMLLFALFLVLNEKALAKQPQNEMFAMAFAGRYCILLMSLYSMFTGSIYNEFFSMPMTLFGSSRWECSVSGAILPDIDRRDCASFGGSLVLSKDGPYPFGLDPIWHGTKTELPYLNSMKMKMSILIGVAQMNMGIVMSLFNNQFFHDKLSTICEFIPQMLFLNGLFGYLCFLMVYKWISGSIADLYHVMIYMFLSPGSMDDQGRLFSGQGQLQLVFVLVALIAVPWMLFPKPLILKRRNEALERVKAQQQHQHCHHDEEGAAGEEAGHAGAYQALPPAAAAHGSGGDGHGHGDHFDFGEIMVHQMIHSIEFVLGAVSNTASYLRLWALSLAHSQLSSVFYDRVLMMAVSMGSPAAMFIGFFVFACATLGVLMVMESLSAFLHALRLHWVEFQNKFYKGDGYAFTPFNFDAIGDGVEQGSEH